MIKLGVFGLCRGMYYLQQAENAGAQITAICDMDPKKLEDAKKYLAPGGVACTDFEEFLKADMDGAVLCNYYCEHAYFAARCMEKGIAVLSETASNVTMAQGVALCRAKEKTGAVYMLAENYPFMRSNLELKRLYDEGSLGRILYAEGEYNHPASPHDLNAITPFPGHWRAHLPRTYYCTHSLAPIMYMTGGIPTTVTAKAVFAPEVNRGTARLNSDVAAIMLCDMNDGSLTRITGCSAFGGHGLYYRLSCLKGTAETLRNDMEHVLVRYNEWEKPEGAEATQVYETKWEALGDIAEKAGHGGGDFWVLWHFVQCLEKNEEPFFDVYRSVAMASVGILGWRSILEGGVSYRIPDFRNEEDRKQWENDELSPFPDKDGKVTLPCCSQPYQYTEEDLKAAEADWAKCK